MIPGAPLFLVHKVNVEARRTIQRWTSMVILFHQIETTIFHMIKTLNGRFFAIQTPSGN